MSIAHSGVTHLYVYIYVLIPYIHFPLTGFPCCGSGNVFTLPWLLIIHTYLYERVTLKPDLAVVRFISSKEALR